jgi:regulator of nonsense transcripts 2
MKRNTGVIRKLKILNEDNSKSLLDDIHKTNQSKYVSEAVQAVAEAPLKLKDIPAAVKVASALHQRYPEFSKELVPSLAKIFTSSGSSGNFTEEEKPTPARKRATLRFLVDLFLHGVFTSHSGLLSIVKQLASTGASSFTSNRDEALVCLSLMTSFVKAGREEILGLPHNDPVALPADLASRAAAGEEADAVQCAAAMDAYNTELQVRWSLPGETQVLFRTAAEKLLDSAIAALQESYEALIKREKANDQILNSRGDLPESLITKYETMRTAFEGLERSAAALAEGLERQLPEFKISALEDEGSHFDDSSGLIPGTGNATNSPFEDEESRIFYQSLPNLREIVPAVLLKGAVEPASVVGAEGDDAAEGGEGKQGAEKVVALEGEDDDDDDDLADIEAAIAKLEIEGIEEESKNALVEREDGEEVAIEGEGEDIVEQAEEDALRKELEEIEKEEESKDDGGSGAATKTKGALDSMISRLPHCVSRELSDEAAVEFCLAGGGGKNARKKLALALTHVPLGALQLLPYYARVAAVLAPLFPDVAETVAKSLEGEFRGLTRTKKKDATNRLLEPRLRNARYIGELVKFKLFPAGTAFRLLKSLFTDFSGHNVDAACALIETAGRYLLRRPDTAQRMTNILEIMMKLKTAKNMDSRLAGLVDSTYYVVKSTAQGPKVKERPPIHEWVRYLIYTCLDSSSVPYVLKKLRRLDWKERNDGSTDSTTTTENNSTSTISDGEYVLRTMLRAVRKGRYSQIKPLASLTAGLSRWHPGVVASLVDAVLEEIVAGMENPEAALYQRRVAAVRFLGELYSYRVVNAVLIFNTLHSLLAYGHTADVPADVTRRLDPPHNYFRLRLVCALVESCGSKKLLSQGGVSKSSRFNNFLPYLQRYILSKPPLPLDIDLDVQEMYSRLEITPHQYESYEAACAAVAKIEAAAVAAAAAGLEVIEEEGEEEEEEEDVDMEGHHTKYDSDGELVGESGGSDNYGEGGGDSTASESGSGSSDEGSSSESESDSEDDSDDSESDEDEIEKTEAEEEFERELAAAMGAGDVSGGSGGVSTGPLKVNSSSSSVAVAGVAASSSVSSGIHNQSKQPSETMALRVMMRRGAKGSDKTQELLIPVPITAANKLREKEAAEAAERAEMKRMVLAANRRDELETVQAAAAALSTRGGRSPSFGRGSGGAHSSRPGRAVPRFQINEF